jgi:UDP-N-acetylmuramyl pentapeptide synthase
MLYFFDVPSIVEGQVIQLKTNNVVTDLLTDSRKIIINPGSVFFASKGKSFTIPVSGIL